MGYWRGRRSGVLPVGTGSIYARTDSAQGRSRATGDLPAESDPNQKRFLRLALEGIVAEGDRATWFPAPVDKHPISAGRHSVELRHHQADKSDLQCQHVIEVLLDDKVVFSHKRPQSWMPANGWTSTGKITETLTWNLDEPAELHRRRFNDPTPTGSRSVPFDKRVNGILIWIE